MIGAAFAEGLARLVGDAPFGLAVSGGGDSVALLVLAHEAGHRPPVATVDHGLRDASAEIAHVAALCAARGLAHEVLRWEAPAHRGGQAAWRAARYDLLAGWARRHGLGHVLTGHTADDAAETLLMRLSRGAGIMGLGGIPALGPGGMVARPLLRLRREALRDHLRERGVGWHDDPANDDPAHERTRVRGALRVLEAQGVRPEGLVRSAERLGEARAALAGLAAAVAERDARAIEGGIALDSGRLAGEHAIVIEHVLSAALRVVSGDARRPYAAKLRAAWATARAGTATTLHGCRLIPSAGSLRLVPEDGRRPDAGADAVARLIRRDAAEDRGAPEAGEDS